MALATRSTQSNAAPKLVSMNPEQFTFGMVDNVDVEFTDAAASTAAQADGYNADDAEAPLFIVEMTDANGSAHAQYYSLGKSEDWAPSQGGEGFVSVSGKNSINATTNLGMFLKSLVENGFPPDLLASGNLKCIIGTKVHVLMKQTERQGLKRGGANTNRPTGVLLVSKIHSLPGTDAKSAAKASVKSAGGKTNGVAATSASGDSDDIDSVLVEKLIEALGEADGNVLPKKALIPIASAAFKGKPQYSKAIARSNAADFLKGLVNSGIDYDGAQFSLVTE